MLVHHIIFGAFYFIGVSGKFWSGKKFGPGSVKNIEWYMAWKLQ